MADRYLIIPRRLAQGKLRSHLCSEGLELSAELSDTLIFSTRPVLAVGRNGVVIGKIFERDRSPSDLANPNSETVAEIEANYGRGLTQAVWGAYVALFRIDTKITVIRDPSGACPCLYGLHGNDPIVASDISLLLAVLGGRPSINWQQLTTSVWNDQICSQNTCLDGVMELRPGERLIAERDNIQLDYVWDPRDFASRPKHGPDDVLATELHACVHDAVEKLCADDNRIFLDLSGGLDSSILAACLSRRAADLQCLTMVGPDARGNETNYVDALQRAIGLSVTHRTFNVSDIEITKAIYPHLPRPRTAYFLQCLTAEHTRLASQFAADIIVSGNGGDNVFSFLQTAAPIADRLLTEGPSIGTYHTLRDMCRLSGSDLGSAIAKTVKVLIRRSKPFQWTGDITYLTNRSMDLLQVPDHPWLQHRLDVLPGKRTQISYLLRAQNFIEGGPRDCSPPDIAPLLAQPIMEFCLAVPSWRWCQDGLNRSLARRAFANDLPNAIVNRRTKGSPGGFLHQVYTASQSQIREVLLSGRMGAQSILDRGALERDLAKPAITAGPVYLRLLELCAVEQWADYWL